VNQGSELTDIREATTEESGGWHGRRGTMWQFVWHGHFGRAAAGTHSPSRTGRQHLWTGRGLRDARGSSSPLHRPPKGLFEGPRSACAVVRMSARHPPSLARATPIDHPANWRYRCGLLRFTPLSRKLRKDRYFRRLCVKRWVPGKCAGPAGIGASITRHARACCQ
jgi:hypothetical protein